jgi:hypothetical protein
MNTYYVIHIKTKHGRITSYRKEKNGWSQTAPTGIVRQLSGDQLLSHLLPPLVGDQPGLRVSVGRKKRRKLKRALKVDVLIEEARTAVREKTLRDWPNPKA